MNLSFWIRCAAIVVCGTGCWDARPDAKSFVVGGFAIESVENAEVREVTDFALVAMRKQIEEKRSGGSVKLELLKVLNAEQQVVAGINHRLMLSVRVNGEERVAQALVWSRAWLKSKPHELTAWSWK